MLIDHGNLAKLDLNLLVAFDALMSERHVTRAAERVGVGQSGMSHSLRRLRTLFADELLIRSGVDMVPTPRAREMADAVKCILSEVQTSILSSTAFDPAHARRTFTIGISPSREITLIPKLLASMRADAPGIRLVVQSDSPEDMLRAIDTGMLDLAIGSFADSGVHHKRRLLFEAEGYLCLYDERRIRLPSPISTDDFTKIPQLMVLSTDHASAALDRSLSDLGAIRHVIYQTPHVQAVPFLLREIDAIAVLCRRAALICSETFGLATSPLPFDLPRQDVAAVWHGSLGRDPAHLWLRRKLFDVANAFGFAASSDAEHDLSAMK